MDPPIDSFDARTVSPQISFAASVVSQNTGISSFTEYNSGMVISLPLRRYMPKVMLFISATDEILVQTIPQCSTMATTIFLWKSPT